MSSSGPRLACNDEVTDAIASGAPLVALESTIISHGLPAATSAETARRIEEAVRRTGAVPATLGVLDGAVRVGLCDDELIRIAEGADVVKTSVRDLGPVLSRRLAGATTVAATAYLAHLAGIRLFATGGLGGVHRGASQSWDESADLVALTRAPVTVVCAGVKSILDVPATLERLESLSVPVVGYRTDVMPGFYVRDAGVSLPWRVETPQEVAGLIASRDGVALPQALVVAQPIAEEDEMEPDLHDAAVAEGLAEVERRGITGKDVTPFLLARLHERTGGSSLTANVALAVANAELAGHIAVALTEAQRER